MIQYPLAVGGTLTRVLEAGEGKDAIVFVHGLGARADRWRATIERFAAAGYRCVAFDLLGHGFAQKGAGFTYTVPAFTKFLASLLDALGIDKTFVIGTSLGGHIGGYFACEAPERVRGLVLVGAVGIAPLGPAAGDAIRRNVRATARENIEGKLRFVLADPSLVTREMIEEEWRINNSPGAAETFERLGDYIAGEIDRDNVCDRLAALTKRIPMLLVWGAEDRAVTPEVGGQVATRLGLPPPILIPGTGHAPFVEKPAEFDRAVLPQLKQWIAGKTRAVS